MEKIDRYRTIIKFSERKYIQELQEGKIYMNTLEYFRNCENEVHKDNLEGADALHQADRIVSLTIEATNIKPIILTKDSGLINFSMGSEHNRYINIYCMYLWTIIRDKQSEIDNRLLEFGDTALIITNRNEFIRRVLKSVKQEGYNCQYGLIEYFDEETFHGDVGIFKKRKSFEYMNEFRIAVAARMDNKPYILNIGSISDISVIIKPHDTNGLQVKFNDFERIT